MKAVNLNEVERAILLGLVEGTYSAVQAELVQAARFRNREQVSNLTYALETWRQLKEKLDG